MFVAGAGRTGVFLTLSIVLERIRYEGVVDVFQTVKLLRTQRPALVQTEVTMPAGFLCGRTRTCCFASRINISFVIVRHWNIWVHLTTSFRLDNSCRQANRAI